MLPGFPSPINRRPRQPQPQGRPGGLAGNVAGAPPVVGTVQGGIQKNPNAQTPAQNVTGTAGTPPPTPAPAGTPYAGPTAPPPGIDQLAEDFARQQLQAGLGPVDTSDKEKLIRELEQQQVGAGLVGNRAAMGRAGFGSSGALGAMQGDTMRQAAQQAAQDILGVRTQAQQQAITNAQAAEGLDIQERNAANQKTELDARLAALQALLGNPPATPGGSAGGGGTDATGQAIADASGISSGTSPLGKDTDQAQTATAGPTTPAATSENPNDPNLPRKTARQGTDPAVLTTSTYTVYKGADGHLYRVDNG